MTRGTVSTGRPERTPITPERLARVRWKGEATYRVLSYYFSLRWNWSAAREYAAYVLEPFAVPPDPRERANPPTPGSPPTYSLLDRGRGRVPRYALLFGDPAYGDTPLIDSQNPGDVLDFFFWHVNSETVRWTRDFVLVHAGAVATPLGEGLVIVGESGSGKTTLTAALLQHGFGYLSDEAAAIDPVTRRLHPYPKALSIKESSAELFSHVDWSGLPHLTNGQRHVRPEDVRPGCVAGPCEVRFVIAHHHKASAVTRLTPITRATALLELARNALNLSTYGARGLTVLADVVRGARSHRLISGSLGEAVALVSNLTRVPGPG